jgi:hypothetical protein
MMHNNIAIILLGFSLIMVSITNISQNEKIVDLSTRLEVLEMKK